MKLALLGTAALAAASISARAETLDSLKAAMDNLTIGAVADAPAAAPPATTISWDGRVRGAVVYYSDRTAGVSNGSAVDIRTSWHLGVTGKTQTAVGEVGASIALQSTGGHNTFGISNGGNQVVQSDGFSGYWKMTPNMTLKAGILGIQKSSYSWDANATNWFAGQTGGGILGYGAVNDPAAFGLYYADGPIGFGLQVYDSDNVYATNASAFGVNAKLSYKMDSIGFDLAGDYAGRAAGSAGWAIGGGLGYSAGGMSIGMAIGTGAAPITGVVATPGSIYGKMALSDAARIEMGVTRDFATGTNATAFGAGVYYSPVKQLTFGIEGGYTTDNANTGKTSFGLVSAFTF